MKNGYKFIRETTINMKKILILEGKESIGGGQIITKKICDILSKEYNVSVFIPGNNTNDISNLLKNYKQFHYKLKPYTRGEKVFKDYLRLIYNTYVTYKKLNKILQEGKYDLIYVQHQNILPVLIIANWALKIKTISHLHVIYTNKKTAILIDRLLRAKWINIIIGVSNYTISQLTSKNKEKSYVLYNPIQPIANILKFCGNTNPNIAIIGDITEDKGHHILFEAIKSLSMSTNYHIHVIGNIVDKAYYEKLLKYNLTVHFTGFITNVSEYLKINHINITVIPSISPFETFSLSMTESWALGIPTIATNDFGMKELVETFMPDYKNDMLFNLGDINELAIKIENLCNNPILYNTISKICYQTIEESLNPRIFEHKLLEKVHQAMVNNYICK